MLKRTVRMSAERTGGGCYRSAADLVQSESWQFGDARDSLNFHCGCSRQRQSALQPSGEP